MGIQLVSHGMSLSTTEWTKRGKMLEDRGHLYIYIICVTTGPDDLAKVTVYTMFQNANINITIPLQ